MNAPPLRRVLLAAAALAALAAMSASLPAAAPPGAKERERAGALYSAGNFREAFDLYRALALDPGNDRAAGNDLRTAIGCLQRLNLMDEEDTLREQFAAAHESQWRPLAELAENWMNAQHSGFIVGGSFKRGYHRGGGRRVTSEERDRVQALRHMARALELAGADQRPGREGSATPDQQADLRLRFASLVALGRSDGNAWRLQDLTDLAVLPDYEEGYRTGADERGAPVGPDGEPVYYRAPERWADCASDGERWRWLLDAAAADAPERLSTVRLQIAHFSRSQFGEQTLAGYPALLRGDVDEKESTGTWALHRLAEDETIARLATGVRRFTLPPDYDFVGTYRRLADDAGGNGRIALEALGEIFENRRQYDKAAEMWRRRIAAATSPSERESFTRRLDQILLPWGDFETVGTQPAGTGASVDYRFRNGRKVRFEAREIDVPRLLADVKAYLESDPRELDWERVHIEQIGWRILAKGNEKYVGRVAAEWEVKLNPRPNHWDRRIPVTTPLKKAGAYLVTARIEDGNEVRIVLWLSDTVIVRKPLDGKDWLFVADAETGKPLPGIDVEFFGYRQEPTDWQKIVGRRYHVRTTSFTGETDADGQLVPDANRFHRDHTWLISTKGGGRFAWLGWGSVWGGRRHDADYKQTKVYTITDRPVYRPGQTVTYKLWIQNTRYDDDGRSAFANSSFTLRLHNPRGEKVLETGVTADAWGGVSGEYALPADAGLGVWRLELHGFGGGSFRVEEYKKPEFEITIEAPDKPARLGEKITATIRARYYFGAPVTDAKVVYKVRRTPQAAQWFPPGLWDWCYGPGYWWFAPDYPWYPGWRAWGKSRPRPFWWPQPSAPPELVAEQEVRIGPDGTANIEIDTALAKELHGDEDHRFEIVAEVTDRSRRTITGTGEVLVARRPFAVHLWTDRGHYRAGDTVQADFVAQTLDRRPVGGDAEVTLFRITYRKGEPREKRVQRWRLRTDAEGRGRLQITAAEGGQYRLSCAVTDGEGRSIEGAQIITVAADGEDDGDFRFNDLELVPDRREYAPGETVRLRVNTDRRGGTVLLFARPTNGVYQAPKVLGLRGKSALEEILVAKRDMPNFFVEALTVSGGRVHTELREIVVPPVKKALDVEVLPSSERYLPGQEAKVRVKVTDLAGRPFAGSTVLSVYDQSVEYVSGGSNVPEIRAFFWKWRRHHNPQTLSTEDRRFGPLRREREEFMRPIGAFGHLVADEGEAGAFRERRDFAKSAGQGARMLAAAPQDAMPAAALMAKKDGAADMAMEASVAAAPGEPTPSEAAAVEPAIRKEFADTAFWSPAVEVGSDGVGEVSFRMPENLTGWKIRAWSLGAGAAVGEGTATVVTAKNLLVRLQAPRFFVERDEVVLSGNVHNYLTGAKAVRAVLELEGGCLEPLDGAPRTLEVPAGGEARADWRVKAVREGEAIVRMKALTDEESDAVEMRFPVHVHGMLKTVSFSGAIRPEGSRVPFDFSVPAERRIEQTRLEVRFSPTLAGALVDALPYLLDYPYGCTEQTLNRFLPLVITQKVLRDLGVPLDQVRAKRANLNAQERGDAAARAEQWRRYRREPVFDEGEAAAMARAGLQRLAAMQVSDGGWGWFSGWGEQSYPHTTAVVVHGLQAAAAAGARLPDGMLERGVAWLQGYQEGEVARLRNAPLRVSPWKERADELDALVFRVLADAGAQQDAMREFLVRDRARLAPSGIALLGLGLERQGRRAELADALRNLEQYLVEDAENQTAWLNVPGGWWWYWYGSETETQAAYLALLARTDPKGARAAALAKYLLNNRKHATSWDSTRDTALCIEALAEFLRASGEDRPDMTVEVLLDGERRKEVRITADDLFTFDNAFVLEGKALGTGRHTLEIRRRGTGPVYANVYLEYFTLEDFITKAGLEVKVERTAYRLRRADRDVTVSGSRGQAVRQRAERYEREPLRDGDTLASGDLVEVELTLDAKNDYEYLIVEDFKAAGFEPVEVRSGYTRDGLGAYLELRDERAAFFLRTLARGRNSLAYRLRAETPGRFSALPARVQAMYAPELRGNSDEIRLGVTEAP